MTRIVAWLLLLALFSPALPSVQAGIGERFDLPSGNRKRNNEVEMRLETYWVNGVGYRPLKVTMFNLPKGKAISPTTFDRDFRVILRPMSYIGSGNTTQVEAVVEIPEGEESGSAWIKVPQVASWQWLEIEVREGGARIDELSERVHIPNYYRRGRNINEASPTMLVIDSDVPSRKLRESALIRAAGAVAQPETDPTYKLPDITSFTSSEYYDFQTGHSTSPATPETPRRLSDAQILATVSNLDKIELIHPSELPNHWTHYTAVDIIVIPLADAVALAANPAQPNTWRALSDWTAAGGTLIITGVGQQLAQLPTVEKLLELPHRPAPADMTPGEKQADWVAATAEFARHEIRWLRSDDDEYSYGYGSNHTHVQPSPAEPSAPAINIDPSLPPLFVIRNAGLGHVAAIADEDPFNSKTTISWLFNQLGSRRLRGFERHGISFTRPNHDFFNYLVKGTGRVPVFSFVLLISVFVIVIGPINYYFLNRARRLYMLLVTVPLGAAFITFSLFAYALLSDGLGVRLRARSFTRIDQTNQRLASWSRQTYYAGLAPSGGLKFPSEAAVYPIDEDPDRASLRRTLLWNDDDQQLRSGYISSRQPAQFLIIRSAATEARLEITFDKAGQPHIVNRLGAKILHLALCDKQGECFTAQDIAAGDGAHLTASTLPEALAPLGVYAAKVAPQPPEGYDPSYNRSLSWNRSYSYNYYSHTPPVTSASSILETELTRVRNPTHDMRPGTYYALLESQPEMPLGYPRVDEQDSLHMVEGTW